MSTRTLVPQPELVHKISLVDGRLLTLRLLLRKHRPAQRQRSNGLVRHHCRRGTAEL
jgi:hypothetical protein